MGLGEGEANASVQRGGFLLPDCTRPLGCRGWGELALIPSPWARQCLAQCLTHSRCTIHAAECFRPCLPQHSSWEAVCLLNE